MKASFKEKSKYFNGYKESRSSIINAGETVDVKESVSSHHQ